MEMTEPLISALIDAYNQDRYIEQAISSVLGQGLSPSELEIVVVDDGSTGNTPSIVQKFATSVLGAEDFQSRPWPLR
jgi:glycosyltransferase involved in cell wall biosynthesis